MGDINMNINDNVINQLIEKAEESFKQNEIPVAAAILDKDNNLISVMGNNRQGSCNVLGHAEINAIIDAEKKIGDWRLDGYYMIVTLEPCDMCEVIIKECRLDHVYYFLQKKSNSQLINSISKSEVDGYDNYKKKFNKLLTAFFDNKR